MGYNIIIIVIIYLPQKGMMVDFDQIAKVEFV